MQPRDSLTSAGRISRITVQPFTYQEGSITLRSGGGEALAYQLSRPEDARAAVIIVHGYAEHSGRYRKLIERWARRTIASAAVDLRGHGWSAGVRGHCERFSDYAEDLRDLTTEFAPHVDGLPMFAFGHSFGALVTTRYALDNPSAFRGLAMTSPLYGLSLKVNAWKARAAEIASRLRPTLSLPSGLTGHDVTNDETVAKQYDNDPLINRNATARWYTEMIAAQEDLRARAASLKLPVLLVQAGADRITSGARAKEVFDRLGSTDKSFVERTGAFHEVLNDPTDGEAVADEIADWILAHA